MFKKFTNISGAKVGLDPKPVEISKEDLEINEFKNSVFKLIDDFLSIRSYGVARPEIMIPTRIVGKEIFVEALTDLITQKSNKDIAKALESLKSTNRDWKSIEDKVEDFTVSVINIKEEKKIKDILEKYGSDVDNLKFFMESHVEKMSRDEAYSKYELSSNMFKRTNNELLKIISDMYFERTK